VSQRTREDQVGRWRREPDSHLEGLKNDITNTVSGREPGGLTNDSSGRIANDCHGRRTEKCTRPRAGETHIPMCPPGNHIWIAPQNTPRQGAAHVARHYCQATVYYPIPSSPSTHNRVLSLKIPKYLGPQNRSNKNGNSTEYMDFQQWLYQLSFPQPPRGTNAGGERGTRVRYISGAPWKTRIDETRWKIFATRTIG
jgi:hypothetical protein